MASSAASDLDVRFKRAGVERRFIAAKTIRVNGQRSAVSMRGDLPHGNRSY